MWNLDQIVSIVDWNKLFFLDLDFDWNKFPLLIVVDVCELSWNTLLFRFMCVRINNEIREEMIGIRDQIDALIQIMQIKNLQP